MRKLEFEVGDSWEVCMGRTRDFVNSQQEAIGELQTEIGVLRNMVLQSQEAIEKLEEHVDHEARHVSEPADDKPTAKEIARAILDEPLDDKPEYKLPGTEEVIEKLDKATLRPNLVDSIPSDTHRTVTLRIPKGMGLGGALVEAYNDYRVKNHQMGIWLEDWLTEISPADLQKALDEVQPNE